MFNMFNLRENELPGIFHGWHCLDGEIAREGNKDYF